MPRSDRIKLRLTGVFSLGGSVELATRSSFAEGFCKRPEDSDNAMFDLAFLLEGCWSSVAVRLYAQSGSVSMSTLDNPSDADIAAVRTRLEQMLSLDVEIASRDPVIAGLTKMLPGVRPVHIPSPYETAARAIIGHRLFVRQAAAVSYRISCEHGVSLNTDNGTIHAFPAPARLAQLTPVHGLADRKVDQLRALGAFAMDGRLDSALLRSMHRDAALTYLQQLPGVGPFSAELIVLRGIRDPDAFPLEEKRLRRAMSKAYHLGNDPPPETLLKIASRWQPYRSWVGLLLRNSETYAASRT